MDAPSSAIPLPCPNDVTGAAAEWWARLAAVLIGRVQPSDSPMLAEACQWLVDANQYREQARGLDPTTVEHGRCLRSATAASAAADRILGGFGLTPADRSKLPPPEVFDTPAVGGGSVRQRVATRPRTPLDLATEAWLNAGGKGVPQGPEFERLLKRFRDEYDAMLTPDERASRAAIEREMETWRAERAKLGDTGHDDDTTES